MVGNRLRHLPPASLVWLAASFAVAAEPQPAELPQEPPKVQVVTPEATENGHPKADSPKARSTIPGLSPDTFTVPPGRYFPEGTFLVRRTGTIRTLKTGESVFIPDMPSPRDARRRGERPMILLPCQTLAAMLSSVATSADPAETRVEVSGQLFVYRERQQLLPTIFTVVRAPTAAPVQTDHAASAPTPPEATPHAATDEMGETTAVRPGDDPEVADIIKQLETRRTEALPQISGAGSKGEKGAEANAAVETEIDQPGAARSLVPEGTIFTDRRGRLVRIGDRLGIAFDGDANTPAEPAMYIIRSKALERLESAIGNRGGTLDIVMTGRVYAYRNQNYILPLSAQLEPIGQIRPLQ